MFALRLLVCAIVLMDFSLSSFLVFLCMNVNGCEGFTHPWEGREPWVKGLVGLNIEVEIFSS